MKNPAQVMTIDEIKTVVKDLQRRALRSPNQRLNLVLFRLSACCGLRRVECRGLDLGDVKADGSHPVLVVRKAVTKGKRRARIVPLDLDQGTLEDIRIWVQVRRAMGAEPGDPFLCSLKKETLGGRLAIRTLSKRWATAVKCLGPARAAQLATHSGRRSFGTHALRARYSLAEVRDWLGHANVRTTNEYLYAIRTEGVPDLFGD